MRRNLFLVSAFSLLFISNSFAFEWKALHDKADNQSLNTALEELRSSHGSAEAFYVLGLVYLNLHKDSLAQGAFSQALRLNPLSFEAEWGLAEVRRRQHKLDRAEPILYKIIKSNPQFSPAYITLAYIRYIRMDFKESVRLASMVIKQGRGNADLSNYTRAYAMYAGAKGMIAHYGGVFSKAIDGLAVKPNLDKAYRLQPGSPGVLFGLGSYYFLAPVIAGGDKVKAEAYLKRAIEADPLFPDAYVRLAQLYKIRGDEKKYDFFMSKALEIDPGNELALDHKSGRCKFICVGGEEAKR